MEKGALRNKYKELRKHYTENEIEDCSLAIANQLLQVDEIWNYEYYHIFLPISAQKEIDTAYLLHILQGKDKHIIVSKSNFDDNTLQHFLLTDQTKLVINEYGIPEPENGIEIADEKIQVVFVPLLAYDKQGNRVGYGKGFYDRFIQKSKPEKVIGLSLFPPEEHITTTDHDQVMHMCISPENIYSFNR